MKIFFIINPVAGNGKTLEHWEKNRKRIFDELGEQNYEMTRYPGHATEIARNVCSEDYDLIVSVGGDGTLNEVVNGIAGSKKAISLIPFGTGSDFGKTLGIRTLEDFLLALKINKRIEVDLPSVYFQEDSRSRYFINILEIGFGAEVMNYVNKHKGLGRYSFLMGIFSTLSRMKKYQLKISLDSFHTDLYTIETIIANGRYFGGGMLASPNSVPDDGILDVHVLKPFSKIGSLIQLRSLITGEYIKKGYSHDFTASQIMVETKDILVEMDGEVVGKTPLKISLNKKRIEFMVP